MIIEKTNSEIIIRLPVDMDIEELQDMKDWLDYLETTRESKAKQKDVDDMVKEVKKGRWTKRKAEILK
nr:hypothetical protein [Bacteroidota bacterium]